jgi:hypothetical protein
MSSMWDAGVADALVARVRTLTPDRNARWGRMSCPQMIAHVSDACRLYLGELSVASKRTPLRYTPLKQLIVYVLPFPRNVPTAPELIARTPGEWSVEVAGLCDAIARVAASSDRRDWPDHPVFGALSTRAWGVLAWRHTDHHLRQFGV